MKTFLRMAAALLLAGLVASCASALRYSADEIKDYPPEVQEHITKGEISIGMTMQQVRYAWGGPQTVRLLQPADDGKQRVEWVYKTVLYLKTRLIFTGERLTEILSSEPGVVK
jgi:hypothetical protein